MAGDCFDDVLPWHGGDYALDETVLGRPARSTGAEDVILFACGCGCSGCGAVYANVVLAGDTLTIRDIFTWRGSEKRVAPIAPIVLKRAQFDDAVRQLEVDIRSWQPSRSSPPTEAARRVLVTPPPTARPDV